MTRRPMAPQVADAALYPVLFRQYLEDGSGFTKDLLGFWRCIGSLSTKLRGFANTCGESLGLNRQTWGHQL